ncbi:MAG: acyltransferase [Elusimicrobia bacterium]|nr:acyltransferase [Elusimicrobiota bacterium]
MPGHLGFFLRRVWLSLRLGGLGAALRMEPGCALKGHRNIRIGREVHIMQDAILHAHEGGRLEIAEGAVFNARVSVSAAHGGVLTIGENAMIGTGTVMHATGHRYDSRERPIKDQERTGGEIHVGADVWIGVGCVVLPNVRIGDHAIVGAGAVVTRDVAPWSIVGGVPAREIKKRP